MQEEEVDRGSESGEMDAGLQIDTGAVLVEMAGTVVVLVGGVNWPLAPLSELTSLVGELFFLAGRTLFWPPFCCCCCCWRHFARRFLNQTWRSQTLAHVTVEISGNISYILHFPNRAQTDKNIPTANDISLIYQSTWRK